jgi:hypothetical protein
MLPYIQNQRKGGGGKDVGIQGCGYVPLYWAAKMNRQKPLYPSIEMAVRRPQASPNKS